jgi:hypothetical protein
MVLKPRSHILSIRISEEEYLTLKHLSATLGARSVSALTRDSMRTILKGVGTDEVLGSRLEELRAFLKAIDRKIDRISNAIIHADKID